MGCLEENIGGKQLDIDLSNDFFQFDTKAKATKVKINKWGDTKVKSFCMEKETINKIKKQPTKWEKIFSKHVSDKGLIYKIYKELIQLSSTQTSK